MSSYHDNIMAELKKQRQEEIEKDADTVLARLQKGPMNHFDLPKGIGRTQLYYAIRCLISKGHRIDRTDHGGNPTWVLLNP